ncbi:addiction module toxin, RelE/StbE family [Acinetobacter marinus]|uniref:Addiction module toxin, RelE/StbE family n=1 Tax=Acinetobacter marinus TaxID=281375 RepID=A0A1G6GV20_9GAMM|nr:type II toxin-antitoxin system RelE/ParE family toxin [Acinetobacter marinus]SDB85818.1 addiction module toxin, RelE/StbE family [Acinetobacter marinus]
MLIVDWTEDALEDLDLIIQYIFEFHPVSAYQFEDHVFQSAQKLSDHPYMGIAGRALGTRELLVHPNYWLTYEVTDVISILSVIHTRKLYP